VPRLGAELCVTEFIRAEQLLAGARAARRKVTLAADDRPTAIQIYGANPDLLMEAAMVAADARPAYVDVNCGCWVPRVARGGAGAGWLRDPAKMVAMAAQVVRAVDLPVTVKTRIGWGPESDMPIVDLARRLEDVGVAGLTIHCRTALQGHGGAADWRWAARAAARGGDAGHGQRRRHLRRRRGPGPGRDRVRRGHDRSGRGVVAVGGR
jgi:tRNA-dihydrouridine synthase B